jgi:hypothetical protein
MDELIKHTWKALVPKNKSFSAYLKDLKLRKFSDTWTINKTRNIFLVHELKMHFNFKISQASYF